MINLLSEAALAQRDLLPSEHLVDTGYLTSDHLVSSQKQQIDLIGPVRENTSWQTRAAAGFGVACFAIDWEAKRATCPAGKTSVVWRPQRDNAGIPVITIRFAQADCGPCPHRPQCVSSSRERAIMIHTRAAYEAFMQARQRQNTQAFQQVYAKRAGIEGTLSQGVRLGDLRRTRYRGLAKTIPTEYPTHAGSTCQ